MSLESAAQMLRSNLDSKQSATEQAPPPEQTPQLAHADTSPQSTHVPEPGADASRQPSGLALLAKQEAAARAREKQLNQRIQELEAASRTHEQRATELSSKWDTLKQKPIDVLDQELGHNWYQNVTSQLTGKQMTPEQEIKELRAKLQDLDSTIDDRVNSRLQKEAQTRAQQEHQESQYRNYLSEAKRLAEENEETEYVRGDSKFDRKLIGYAKEHYDATGEVLTPSEVLLKMEQDYEEDLTRLAGTAKFKKKFGNIGQLQSASKTPARTLTSDLKNQPPLSSDPEDAPNRAARVLSELRANRR